MVQPMKGREIIVEDKGFIVAIPLYLLNHFVKNFVPKNGKVKVVEILEVVNV